MREREEILREGEMGGEGDGKDVKGAGGTPGREPHGERRSR